MKRLLLLTTIICSLSLSAQVSNEFWFAPPWMNSHHTGEAEFHLMLSAYDHDAHVRITQPANADKLWVDTIVRAHSYADILLAPKTDHKQFAEANLEVPYNQISKRGLYITSDHDITAYYQITHANGEAFTLKGKNALGTEFVVMGQNRFANQPDYSGYRSQNNSIQIVASADNTHVTITPSQPVLQDNGTVSADPITLTLQRGETYAVRSATTTAAGHLIGTRIVSDQPIAVTTTDDSVINGSGQDAVGEQLVSTDFAGTDFTAIPLSGSVNEYVFVLALEDNTEVTLSNGTTWTLNALESNSMKITTATYIHADHDVQVFQFTGRNSESGGTVLPQMLCTGSRHVTYKRIPQSEYTVLNLLTQAANIRAIYINGREVPESAFSEVPGTEQRWYYATIDVTDKPAAMPIEVEAERGVFQLGIVDYTSKPQGSLTYGFFSDYANASGIDIMADGQPLDTLWVTCQGGEITLVASAVAGISNFTWYRNDELIYSGDTLYIAEISGQTDGFYRVHGESEMCTVEDHEFHFVAIARQDEIPVEEVVIDEGESYTWAANGQTYSTDARDTVWFSRSYGELPIYDCDTAAALHVRLRRCAELTIDCPGEVCGDERELLIAYTVAGSGAFRQVEVKYSDAALAAGFENDTLAVSATDITLPIPEHIWADSYDATLTILPEEDDCGVQTLPIHFTVRYPSGVFTQKWNDVLAVYNEHYNRGEGMPGYQFTAYQWYKNGQPIEGATGSYYYVGPTDRLDFDAQYSVLLTRADGSQIRSCDYQPVRTDVADDIELLLGNTTTSGQLRIRTSQAGTAVLYDPLGRNIARHPLTGGEAAIAAPSQQGVYLLHVQSEGGNRRTFQVIVTE